MDLEKEKKKNAEPPRLHTQVQVDGVRADIVWTPLNADDEARLRDNLRLLATDLIKREESRSEGG